MTLRVRFAPSPTGRLHVGNARTALMNMLFARKAGAKFLLRVDDTDLARSTAENEAAIEHDLAWLGCVWDEKERQSERFHHYRDAANRLRDAGLLYPCYETEEELERRRRIALSRGRPPVYDRAALKLTASGRAELEAEGRAPHWRFKLSGTIRVFEDLIRGRQAIDTATLSDPVLIRADGTFLYTLPSVVDDAELAISHIIRGEDHVTNSGVQIEIFEALGAAIPAMAHTPLLADAEGGKLAKRLGSLSIEDLREDGIEPLALCSLLAKIGTSDPVEPRSDLAALADEFDFAKIGRAPARFDEEELLLVNARLLHGLDYPAAREGLIRAGVDLGADFWHAVRPNLERMRYAAEWAVIVNGPIAPVIGDRAFCAQAAALLPAEPWGPDTWRGFTEAVKAQTGARGKALFLQLRLALTAREHGPDMGALFPLIGRARAAARLMGEAG